MGELYLIFLSYVAPNSPFLSKYRSSLFKSRHSLYTVVPVFSGLCEKRTPSVYGQYSDVRGDFQYKLTRDQRTPANTGADRHFVLIFAPQPGDSALFILFYITLGCKRYRISLLMRMVSLKRMSTPADVRLGRSENEG